MGDTKRGSAQPGATFGRDLTRSDKDVVKITILCLSSLLRKTESTLAQVSLECLLVPVDMLIFDTVSWKIWTILLSLEDLVVFLRIITQA